MFPVSLGCCCAGADEAGETEPDDVPVDCCGGRAPGPGIPSDRDRVDPLLLPEVELPELLLPKVLPLPVQLFCPGRKFL